MNTVKKLLTLGIIQDKELETAATMTMRCVLVCTDNTSQDRYRDSDITRSTIENDAEDGSDYKTEGISFRFHFCY